MLLSDYLFNESKKIWDEYLTHPFIIEMGKGTLDKEKFKEYLIQDYLYLLEYAKVYAMGLIKSDKVDYNSRTYNSGTSMCLELLLYSQRNEGKI